LNQSTHEGNLVNDAATDFLDLRDIAKELKCSTRTARRLSETGAIPAPQRFGRLLRWPRATWEKFCANGGKLPPEDLAAK
jgi:predicted DNA-binding transcriptional regulator AlpA